jgi:hypothetical protein
MTAPYEDRHCVVPAARALRPAADVHFRIVCLHQGPEAADCDTDRSYEQQQCARESPHGQVMPRFADRDAKPPGRVAKKPRACGEKTSLLCLRSAQRLRAAFTPECGWRRCGPFRPPPSEGNEAPRGHPDGRDLPRTQAVPAATASRLGLDQFVLSSSVGGDHMTDRAAEARACGRGTR